LGCEIEVSPAFQLKDEKLLLRNKTFSEQHVPPRHCDFFVRWGVGRYVTPQRVQPLNAENWYPVPGNQ
jgi:hypothetical protein